MEALDLSRLPFPKSSREIEELFYSRYDELIRVVCPDYDEMLDRLVEHIPAGTRSLLDLGCGTGNLLDLAAQRLPGLERLVGVDFSDEVLERALWKLSRLGTRLELINLDIRVDDLPVIPVRTSALTLHNLPPAVQMTLYVKILQGASCFLHYDLIRGSTGEQEAERWRYLKWWMTQQGVPAPLQSLACRHMLEDDQPLTIEQHRRLCESAGMSFKVLCHSPGFVLFRADRRPS